MSTHSTIVTKQGGYIGIYCNFDGYPRHNGVILYNNYKTQAQVDALIKLGNLISLGKTPASCESYASEDGKMGENAPTRKSSPHQIANEVGGEEYVYVFEGGKWTVNDEFLEDVLVTPEKKVKTPWT